MVHTVDLMGDNGVYYVRQIDPLAFTFEEALHYAELLLESFGKDDLFHYWFGPRYRYDDSITLIRQSIKDPRERLDAYIDKARSFKRLTRAYARDIHIRVLGPSDAYYGLYTKQEGYERLVGMSTWRYPKYMQEPKSIWHKLYATWIFYKYKVIDFFEFFGQGVHPLNNPRAMKYINAYLEATQSIPDTPEEGDRLATLTQEQLAIEPYRESDYIYLALFLISPDYQRKGLGTRFFDYTLSVLRDGKTPFVSRDGLHTSFGPTKQMLTATVGGRQLYLKYGFKDVNKYTSFPEVTAASFRMERAVTK